jgi:hypothetical protein
MPDDLSDPDRRPVRLFVGHAESPVWFPDPRGFEEMHLDDNLTDALRAWDAEWYSSRRPDDFEWIGATPEIEHDRRRVDLAYRISRALGSEFVVEVDPAVERSSHGGYTVPEKLRIRSDGPPLQPEAAAQFTVWADLEHAERERFQRAVDERAAGETWSAYAPLSGTTFRSGRPKTRGR